MQTTTEDRPQLRFCATKTEPLTVLNDAIATLRAARNTMTAAQVAVSEAATAALNAIEPHVNARQMMAVRSMHGMAYGLMSRFGIGKYDLWRIDGEPDLVEVELTPHDEIERLVVFEPPQNVHAEPFIGLNQIFATWRNAVEALEDAEAAREEAVDALSETLDTEPVSDELVEVTEVISTATWKRFTLYGRVTGVRYDAEASSTFILTVDDFGTLTACEVALTNESKFSVIKGFKAV